MEKLIIKARIGTINEAYRETSEVKNRTKCACILKIKKNYIPIIPEKQTVKRKIFSILISVFIIQMDITMPFLGTVRAVQTGSPPTITISGSSSQSVHVENVADYTLTVKNNCDFADYINIELSGVNAGWSAKLLASDNSMPLSDHNSDGKFDIGLLNPGESCTFYLHVTPSNELCNNTQDIITVIAAPASGNCNSSSANTTVTAVNTGILEITKEANPTEAKVGDAVTWTMHIRNTGDDPIGNVYTNTVLKNAISKLNNFNAFFRKFFQSELYIIENL